MGRKCRQQRIAQKSRRLCPQCDQDCNGDCYPDKFIRDEFCSVPHRQRKVLKRKICYKPKKKDSPEEKEEEARVPYPLLNARIPPEDEIREEEEAMKAFEAIQDSGFRWICGAPHCGACSSANPEFPLGTGLGRKTWPSEENGDSDDDDDDWRIRAKRTATTYEALRNSFFLKQRKSIAEMFPELHTLRVTHFGRNVVKQFMQRMKVLNFSPDDLELTLHGTRMSNHSSICCRGLIVPERSGIRTLHGSSFGVGIYSSKSFQTSEGYCDDSKMFVCAIIDDTTREEKKTYFRRSDNVRFVADTVVTFDESHIIPMFTAEFTSERFKSWQGDYWGGHGNVNHVSWLNPSVYECVAKGKKVKRRRVPIARTKDRRLLREIKWKEQCCFPNFNIPIWGMRYFWIW